MTRALETPPAALVEEGSLRFGTYSGPIPVINPLDTTHGWRRRLANLRLREWEAFQIDNGDWFLCGAVYTTKTLGVVQLIAVEQATGRIHRWLKKVPVTRVRVAQGMDGTRSRGRTGAFTVSVENAVGAGELRVTASHPGNRTLPAMRLDVTASAPDQHLVICHPFTDTTALYSHKGLWGANGTLSIGDEEIEFAADRSYLLIDDHKATYPLPVAYDWVTGGRRAAGEPAVAFNLTRNEVRDPETFNENAIFDAGGVHRLPPVTFARPHGVHEPWQVRDAGGQVDLVFTPRVRSEVHVGPRRSLSEYFGPYGTFTGTLRADDGAELDVDGCYGMGEQCRIRL